MNCPDCGKELTAVGGIPTVWHCRSCIKSTSSKKVNKFIGDTLETFKRLP